MSKFAILVTLVIYLVIFLACVGSVYYCCVPDGFYEGKAIEQ